MAGLPRPVSDLLSEGVSTFLRGAKRYDLHHAPLAEVCHAFGSTFGSSDITIDDYQLDRLTEFADGYPYLIQLVGYHVFKLAAHRGTVSTEDVRSGVERARSRLEANVLQSALHSTTEVDRIYLLRMAEDEGVSSIGIIARRIDVSEKDAEVYWRRLVDAGVIKLMGPRRVDFAMPLMREFLRSQLQHDL